MKSILRTTLSLIVGCAGAVAVAAVAVLTARALWPEYAAAEPQKHYTLGMLFVRLAVGALGAAMAACVTTAVAGDNGRAAWWLGGLFFALSVPDHIYPGYAWNDYPVWYHVTYLSYLVPITGLTAQLFRRLIPCKAP
ncbi:hypothetical protein [Terriglobus tenax]|uniref:hypothetical protein n=1 Tax=Terriglobus tenax TaxID=1111115 RepID=UPI0021DFE9BC|nr:hypothetical protein [Terriglobus tenax]